MYCVMLRDARLSQPHHFPPNHQKVHESIESSVNFSFNYNTLLLVASVLAGLGLVSNSSTIIIVSLW